MLAMNKAKVKAELQEIINNSSNNLSFKDYIENLKKNKVVIYGAGYCGRFVAQVLLDNGIKPEYFLDANAQVGDMISGISVNRPNSYNSENEAIVIVCVMATAKVQYEIIQFLISHGYDNVIVCQDIYFSFSKIFDANSPIIGYDYVKDHEKAIIDCVNLFSDDLSLETYKNNISAYLSRRLDKTQSISSQIQYFPRDIDLLKGYSRFIDCGAFDGDTINELITLTGMPQAVVAFEPDLTNFAKLSKMISEKDVANAVLFPCGLSNRTETLRFNIRNNTQSSLCESGNTVVQCVALDDVLKDVAPTFIKMDIEGAEYDALLGAKHIIEKYKPDLAICVYHEFNHYYEIPRLINSWNLGYRFYLRTHDKCATETVLYATTEE